MADLILIEQLATYLVDQGIARPWAASGSLPQVIKNPRDGAPQPGLEGTPYAGETAIITVAQVNQIPPVWLEEFIEQPQVQVIVRAFKSAQGELIQRQISRALTNKRLFTMGALTVEWCQQFAGVSPIGADELSYDTAQTFVFGVRTKALAGLPYA